MKILVIDKDDLILTCLATVDAELLCHHDEIQALNAADMQQPALIFLDYGLRGKETPDFIRMLTDVVPATRLVIIGAQINEDEIIQCMLAGAKGFQEQAQLSFYAERLIQAILKGEAWLSRKSVARLIDSIRLLTT
jgi:DNA-binding NarL/FixJ family response regulator